MRTEKTMVSDDNTDSLQQMFQHRSKLLKVVDPHLIENYKNLLLMLKEMQNRGQVAVHHDYLNNNELALNIYRNKYYLKDLKGQVIEDKPEDVFARLAAFMAAMEQNGRQEEFLLKFYNILYNGYFMPGGRVIAGAGDLYRLKTLANCFVSVIEDDNIESIYKAAYECARTYSYGGGIGVDISNLRPKDSVVHNAADKSTGAVSFMELYSLTTGLIGQSGRRGALMLTLDVKHPDVLNFINTKRVPNWVTKQIIEQCKWSNLFDEKDLRVIENQVRENTQVRFANISLKVSDEFMKAVEEETKYGKQAILLYKKYNKVTVTAVEQGDGIHYSYGIPSKSLQDYESFEKFDSVVELNKFLATFGASIAEPELKDMAKRDLFGDYVIPTSMNYDLAVKYAGDFMLYFGSDKCGEIKRLVKARQVWDLFVAGNYKTAEPGLIFWTTMSKYSPSNYVGRPIASTNPCGEIPLEDGGACNLGSINLSRFVIDGYTKNAHIDWQALGEVAIDVTRFLDNVVAWNEFLNPLEKQKHASNETRRVGLGIMGIADMLNQLGIPYDSDEGIALMEKVSRFIANKAYESSAQLAEEKGASPLWDYEKYSRGPFFQEVLDPEVQELVKQKGLRNIALLSIAPTGTISNVVLGFVLDGRHYIGVSGGIEPIFALYYTRRSESFGNKFFKMFHATVQAYVDMMGLQDQVNTVNDDELKKVLPAFFFRTAHYIEPEKRVQIQGVCQKYIDHSISSTVNLPESIDPEVISSIYLEAWRKGLKGITIYRDGSRYPILSVQQEQNEFQKVKDRSFKVLVGEQALDLKGDEVFTLPDGTLSTPFHALRKHAQGVVVNEVGSEVPVKVAESHGDHKEGKHDHDDTEGSKVCKIEFVNGQLVKSCGE